MHHRWPCGTPVALEATQTRIHAPPHASTSTCMGLERLTHDIAGVFVLMTDFLELFSKKNKTDQSPPPFAHVAAFTTPVRTYC